MPNTVLAAAEGLPNVNRRRMLNLAGAGLALAATSATVRQASAATMPPAPAAAPESEIMTAFREWHALYEQAYLDPALDDDTETGRLLDVMKRIEDSVREMPAGTATELLAKFMMVSIYGSFSLGADEAVIYAEARAVLS